MMRYIVMCDNPGDGTDPVAFSNIYHDKEFDAIEEWERAIDHPAVLDAWIEEVETDV